MEHQSNNPDNCPHDISHIEVISVCVTCETTRVVCSSCKEEIKPPKTEC